MPTTYSDQKSCLEAIGRILVENVPEPWTWIRTVVSFDLDATMTESTYQPLDQVKEPEPFDIEDATVGFELVACFRDLAALLATEKAEPFKKCHYFLQNDGKYRADYEY